MNIHKFTDSQPDNPFHSSGYAQVANGNQIGSTNAQTFGQRYRIDQNRQAVRKYRDSYVAQNRVRGAGASSERSDATGETINTASRRGGSAIKPIGPVRTFREPPPRYNPFG